MPSPPALIPALFFSERLLPDPCTVAEIPCSSATMLPALSMAIGALAPDVDENTPLRPALKFAWLVKSMDAPLICVVI